MKSSDSLFRLVKAMNKSEKRYFTVMSKTHRGENDALKLFRVIDSMEKSDEQELRKKLIRSGTVGKAIAGRLDVAKVQLYNTLLRNMRLYHENENVENQVINLQVDCTFLYEKGLTEEALRRIRKAKALAYEFEKFRLIPALLSRERELVLAFGVDDDLLKSIKAVEEEMSRVMAQIENLNYYSHWAHLMASAGRMISADLRRELDNEFMKLVDTANFNDPENCFSVHAKRLQAYTCSTWYLLQHDPASAHRFNLKQAEVLESAPHLIAEYPKAYITAIYNAIVSCHALEQFDEARKLIKKLRALPENLPDRKQRSPDLRLRVMSRVLNMELGIILSKAEFDLKLINRDEIEEMIPLIAQSNDRLRAHEIALGYATILYACGEHRAALEQLRLLLFASMPKMRGIVAVQGSLLFLMIHFDRGNEKMEKFVKTRLKGLENLGAIQEVEQLLFDWIAADEAKFKSGKEQREAWSNFRIRLEKALKDTREFHVIDFLAWVDSKITGKTYAQCAKYLVSHQHQKQLVK